MDSTRQVQKFKALQRKKLTKQGTALNGTRETFTLARINKIKRQPLNLTGVEVLEHEIDPDNWE